MIFITENQLHSSLKKCGFSSYDEDVLVSVNDSLLSYVKNSMKKALKKNKDVDVLSEQHFQKGGRTVFPSEYFGHESGSYFESLNNNGTDMSVTNTMIRPAILTQDLSGAITGGKSDVKKFKVSNNVIQNAVMEVKTNLSKNIALKKSAISHLKQDFETKMNEILQKTHAKSESQHLSIDLLKKVLSMKKYQEFRD
jgi:hypothetical protein